MPSAAQILDRIVRLRAAGKIIHLTPHTAGVVEAALRAAVGAAGAQAPPPTLSPIGSTSGLRTVASWS